MLTLTDLNECFEQAKENESRYIGVRINVGLEREEVIINPYQNFTEKQAYYNRLYDESLTLKSAVDVVIRINGYAHGDSFADIERQLETYDITGSLIH